MGSCINTETLQRNVLHFIALHPRELIMKDSIICTFQSYQRLKCYLSLTAFLEPAVIAGVGKNYYQLAEQKT